MLNGPLLSVGIALYRSDFLESLFTTLEHQTYKNIEYIISIDSPKDPKVQDFVVRFKNTHNNVKVYNHNPALGATLNAVFVVENSSGEYFIRLDDDDSFRTNTHLESLINRLRGGYDYVFPNTDVEQWKYGKYVSTRRNTMKYYEGCYSKFDFSMASLDETAMLFYAMYRTEKIKEIIKCYKALSSNTHHVEGVLVHNVASNLRGCYVPNETFIYRIHGNNVSRTTAVQEVIAGYKVYIKESLKIFAFHKEFSFSQKYKLLRKLITKAVRYLFSLYKTRVKQSALNTIYYFSKFSG